MPEPDVRLAPPGAGLPAAELWLARAAFALMRRATSRDRAGSRFRREADRLLELVTPLDPAMGSTRVLIRRIRGIEDNSRYWSAYMVLDHLVRVNETIVEIVEHLAAGRKYERAVGIPDVKPGPEAGPKVVERFAAACESYLLRITLLPQLKTEDRHVHPWFGPLNGHAWHVLAALHQSIHRRQVERIIGTLSRGIRTVKFPPEVA